MYDNTKGLILEEYLRKKYGFFDNAAMPVEMIGDELHISTEEAKNLVRSALGRRSCPLMVSFGVFVQVCAVALGDAGV